MDARRQVLLALAGDEVPPDSPLARHLPAARAALYAFCRGDDAAMEAALKQLPFRSPYRDLRWWLAALACQPREEHRAEAWLARIGPDSPFREPARLTPPFLKSLRPAETDDEALFRRPLARAREDDDPSWQNLLKQLLVHCPQCREDYERHFGPLDEADRLRLQALHLERYGDPREAFQTWVQLGKVYQTRGDRLEAAAVARHRAELARRHFGPGAEEIEQSLIPACQLDPGCRQSWQDLADYYRLRGDRQRRRRVLEAALEAFPDDDAFLTALAEAAFERGAYKKAIRLFGRVLARNPLDREARRRLFDAVVAQVGRQLAAGRSDLARKEVAAAEPLAETPKDRARWLALEGIIRQQAGLASAEIQFYRAREQVPAPWGDWLIALLQIRLGRPEAELQIQRKALKQAMDLAARQPPDKTQVLALLDEAAVVAAQHPEAVSRLFSVSGRYFRRALTLSWTWDELRDLGERLLTLECWQWLRDLVRRHPAWGEGDPRLVYCDLAAKSRGVPGNLDLIEVQRLVRASETAAVQGQDWLIPRIDALLAANPAPPVPAEVPVSVPAPQSPAEMLETARVWVMDWIKSVRSK
ncbi:hypothetical protein MIT9_P0327 [Methylomarinovum caldicuralii]|uniref:Tetratricopeptide repeat protein n=1 Tax=Methylomarinovum caldicuralii TaxID=438856 RepID=A0AAU9C5R4_9GAMM|nr:tetratricopeptide repeat protein [Methylomarinovum caldicuralii]BCX80751.1 hypothetical protein MIT9_P0327 [Methylomarinovum caldicuralii]